jgi:hypothetical protein
MILSFLLLSLSNKLTHATNCAMLNYCNGHGVCNPATSTCSCYEGYGASTDITLYRAPDCSALTCPSGRAWADVPSAAKVAHAYAECSNMGTCNRKTGKCQCFDGFTGEGCQRSICPKDCSGHGQCLSMKELARSSAAQPLNENTYYEGDEVRSSSLGLLILSFILV